MFPHRRGKVVPIRSVWCLLLSIALAGGLLAVVSAPTVRAEPAAAPVVIPTLADWRPGDGMFRLRSGSRILADHGSVPTARTLAAELADRFGRRPVVAGVDLTPRPGDVVLRTDPDAAALGREGYDLTVGRTVRISARTDAGTYYGTRTLLQSLTEQGRAPSGSTRDIPRYADRGVGICACALKISVDSIERLITDLSYHKLNYLLLPLKIKNADHPEINQWSYYTPAEARRIVAFAGRHHVRVIPEINAPGHMEPYLFDRPDLQLADVDGKRSAARIDITEPEAFDFYTDLIDSYAAIFGAAGQPRPEWHLGADEYMISSSYQHYPQIADYARRRFGPDAQPEDAFVDFVNRIAAYARKRHGMALRIWNDGLPERNVITEPGSPHPRLDHDITIEHWTPGEVPADQLITAGYRVTNAASSLYEDSGGRVSGHRLCPAAPRLADCLPQLWEDGWSPRTFEDGTEVGADSGGVTGAHLSLWQSTPVAETEVQLERRIDLGLRLLAERTWTGQQSEQTFAQFRRTAQRIGHGPGWRDPAEDQRFRPGSYRVQLGTGGRRRYLSTDGDEAGSPATASRRANRWQLDPTDDGYYRLTAPSSGLCLTAVDAGVAELLESAPAVGSSPRLQECRDSTQTQKWQLRREGRGLTLINAIHQLPITVADAGDGRSVRLQPPDRVRPALLQLDHRTGLVGRLAAPELLEPGAENRIRLTLTNHGRRALDLATARLITPDGWRAQARSKPPETIRPGRSVTLAFDVTPPPDATTGSDHRLSAAVGYREDGERRHARLGRLVRIDPISCVDPSAPAPQPDDDFDGDSLDGCRWTQVRDPDLDTLDVGGGRLSLRTGPGDLAGPGGSIRNLLLQPATPGDWSIELTMTAPLHERYHQAGLMVQADDDNYVEYVLVSDSAPGEEPRLYLSLVSEQGGEFGKGGAVNVFDVPRPPDDGWRLRLSKHGDRFSAASSTDGRTWTPMPDSVTNSGLTDAAFGLFAAGPGQTSPTTVSFDRFLVP